MRKVDPQNGNRGATYGGTADQLRSLPTEVPGPFMPAWMEQANDFAREGINSREIGPFAKVAFVASPGEVAKYIPAAVLSGDNVFSVKREERVIILVHQTIFAAVSGPLANQFS